MQLVLKVKSVIKSWWEKRGCVQRKRESRENDSTENHRRRKSQLQRSETSGRIKPGLKCGFNSLVICPDVPDYIILCNVRRFSSSEASSGNEQTAAFSVLCKSDHYRYYNLCFLFVLSVPGAAGSHDSSDDPSVSFRTAPPTDGLHAASLQDRWVQD